MFYVQAAINDRSNRINVMQGLDIAALAAFAETFFINNNYYDVRIIGHNGKVATDHSGNKPFECIWTKPQ